MVFDKKLVRMFEGTTHYTRTYLPGKFPIVENEYCDYILHEFLIIMHAILDKCIIFALWHN